MLKETLENAVTGAIYDFLGFLTTQDTPITMSSTHESCAVIPLLQQWADKRDLSLKNSEVEFWQYSLQQACLKYDPEKQYKQIVEKKENIIDSLVIADDL